ncbi:MAG TPA: 4-hydroxyphenylpyruvate dioxygenase [Acidimicrobiales bacterium]|nr:4-hydroxyphenylpyruvate dioxygenase [Acidimicrobiales bacterium]
MTSTIEAAPATAPADLMTGFHHLELWVGNARAFTHLLQSGFGFTCVGYLGPETGVRDRVTYLLREGSIELAVTAPLAEGSPIAAHVARHGDGVRSVALGVRDLAQSVAAARRRGAHLEGDGGADGETPSRTASIVAYGETRLQLVDAALDGAELWPALVSEGLPSVASGGPVGLARIDHVVANVEEGRLDEWVAWHRSVLGLKEMRHFDADAIGTEFSALRSTVLWNGRDVVLPVNEPAPGRRKSQIEEYLDAYVGPGVQHVALATEDIVGTVDELQRRGVRFLVPPAEYYPEARRRVGAIDLPWGELERLGVLVDVESGGYLLQVFTETLGDRPTLFLEVIERRGATGFGEGNFKALFEAIEREQGRRGNLDPTA